LVNYWDKCTEMHGQQNVKKKYWYCVLTAYNILYNCYCTMGWLLSKKKNQRTLHEDQYIFLNISRSVLLRLRNVSGTCCRENQNAHFIYSIFFFLSKIVPFIRWCGKILLSPRSHRWQYVACALHVGYLRLQTHTFLIRNIYCFSPATMVARKRLSVTLYVHCLACNAVYSRI